MRCLHAMKKTALCYRNLLILLHCEVNFLAIILLGVSFFIQAILHFYGFPFLISKKHRNSNFRKQFQRGLVFPYAFLGIGWFVLGITHRSFEVQNSWSFCFHIILIAIFPFFLLVKNKNKYKL